jgi:hypothetical protein
MPVFNEKNFPKPGELTVSQSIEKMRSESELRRRSMTYGATLAAPLKEPTPLKLVDIKAPPRNEAAPARSMEQISLEVYNPYARQGRTTSMRKTTSTDIGLYAAVTVLVLAGTLLLSTFFIQKFAERQIANAIHKAAAPFAETATVGFSSVSVSLFKRAVTIHNIQIGLAKNDETITIEKASVWGIDWPTLKQMAMTRKPVLPKTVKFAATNVRAGAGALGPQGAQMLQAMGYQDIAFSTSADLAMTPKTFNLKNFAIDAKKMARLNLSLSLANLAMPKPEELARLKKDPKLILTESGDFTKATIRSFAFTFEDKTITRRLINFFEHTGETSPETLATMALAINGQSRNPASVDFVKPALETLIVFFQKPTSLTLTAKPARDVPVLSLLDEKTGGSVNELAHKLNLTFE